MRLAEAARALGTALVLCVLAGGQAAAEVVPIGAAAHQGYGRIVFRWPASVAYDANLVDDRLIVRFGAPIEATYGTVLKGLGRYVRAVEPGADGRSVTFLLTGRFGLRAFDIGHAVVVDLLDRVPPGSVTGPSARSQGASRPAEAKASTSGGAADRLPTVGLRAGVHEGYTRLVFDWPRRVNYRVDKAGGTADVTFAKAGTVDLGPLRSRPPRYVRDMRSELKDGRLNVRFSVPETARLRHFFTGSKVVVDILAPSAREKFRGLSEKSPAGARRAAAGDRGRPTEGGATAPGASSRGPPGTKGAGGPTPLRPGKPIALVPPNRRQGRGPKAGSRNVASLTGNKITGTESGKPGGSAAGQVTTGGDAEAATAKLRFDWAEPVGAAVFRRAGRLWVVFDKAVTMNVEALRAQGGDLVRSLVQLPSRQASVLLVETPSDVNPSIGRDGLAWILTLGRQALAARTPIEIKSQPTSPVGPRLFLPVSEPGKAIALRDPEVGDNIVVVPIIPLGYGVAHTYRYPQASILKSGQGLAIVPKIDDLRVRPLRQGVELTSATGLYISPVTAEQASQSKLDNEVTKPLTRILDLEKWTLRSPSDFYPRKQALQLVVAKAKGPARERARLDLARFYFANGFGAEALGVLRLASSERPEMLKNPEFRLLRGASQYLMGRYATATADLSDPSLDGNDEAVFWRAAARAGAGDLAGAAADLTGKAGVPRSYPKALKMPLGLLIAASAVDVGDIKNATRLLESLAASQPGPADKAEIDYLEGRVQEASGDFEAAIAKWETAMADPHGPSRARAAEARVELLLKRQLISPKEAIDQLEKLRFAWRGDEFEFQLLRRLGRLYMDEGDYRDGLRTLRQAATNFRHNPEAPEVTQEMADAFSELYLDDGADSLPPVTAIALYQEFKELTPAGAKGDEMIRKLADRLAAVDLLEPAAKLLEDQVRFRLEGELRARVAARLAVIYMLDRKYEKAITVLQNTRLASLPKDLVDQRRHLHVRALMGLGRNDEALALIKDDKSIDADKLRVEIYWNARDWANAAQALRRLVRDSKAKPGEALNEEQGRYILNEAIALTLGGDDRRLERLRSDYGAAMEKLPMKDAFRLIANPESQGLIDYRSIASKVKQAENFQSFMTAYQERLKKEGLSAIN